MFNFTPFHLFFPGTGAVDQLLCHGAGEHGVSFGAFQWSEGGRSQEPHNYYIYTAVVFNFGSGP